MVDLAVLVEDQGQTGNASRDAILKFFSGPTAAEESSPFAKHFFTYLVDDPNVAMAYAAVRRALANL